MVFTLRDIRKAPVMVPILVGFVWLSGACKAKLPFQVALDAGVVAPCSIYADKLVAFTPAGSEGGSELGSKALGAPDSEGVPLSQNSVLTVAFLGLGSIEDEVGDDMQIHASLGAGAEVAVYVGFGDQGLEYSGALSDTATLIDLATARARAISYVQLVGITGDATIDAFESLQTGCTAARASARTLDRP